MRHPKTMTAVAILSLCSVGIAGCSSPGNNGAEEAQTSLASQAATEAPSATPTIPPADVLYPHPKPEMPAEAHEHSALGAQAFSVYAMKIFMYSVSIRDPKPLRDICVSGSESCANMLDFIEGIAESDAYYEGFYTDDIRVKGSLDGGSTPRAEYGTQLQANVPEYKFYENSANSPKIHPKDTIIFAVEVSWDEGWKVSDAQAGTEEEAFGD